MAIPALNAEPFPFAYFFIRAVLAAHARGKRARRDSPRGIGCRRGCLILIRAASGRRRRTTCITGPCPFLSYPWSLYRHLFFRPSVFLVARASRLNWISRTFISRAGSCASDERMRKSVAWKWMGILICCRPLVFFDVYVRGWLSEKRMECVAVWCTLLCSGASRRRKDSRTTDNACGWESGFCFVWES